MLPDPQKGLGRYYSYLNSAVKIIGSYQGHEPLAHFLKNYFSREKKYGGSDRKQVTQLCYAYYRLGKDFADLSFEQRVLLGLRLSSKEIAAPWNALLAIYKVPETFSGAVFPWKDQLSGGIDPAAFEHSFFVQPDLFLRIRPGNEAPVIKKLEQAALPFQKEGDALRLPNTAKAGEVLALNSEAVIQDLSSQRIAGFLHRFKSLALDVSQISPDVPGPGSRVSVWDCCAASGGKSILAADVLGTITLTVSDIRPSIIANLKKRFHEAGIKNFRSLVTDATKPDGQLSRERFDLVIADVPCSGSGTWSRTPERLHYFSTDEIKTYAGLQRRILANVTQSVKPGGFFLYITCSVFRAENEDQVAWLQQRGWVVKDQQVLEGYKLKADTMFGALLQKKANFI
ncbi:methyltransferase domain-containing protein [Niabella drilacis]|uniref:16S rRNA (Cytosine967-C5)-methyltransferase n=1 Tax=Niabella drilacis (strain DSM 25811 / CCM 8410 / CCUG 62505 / LMG 26954 / E90) TaxID=1285928 RepID=A0A1G6KT10_NIADE|nr:RsmB/NOP family class I SAM-dependent RNA methyltransferase [Niabella drilacis]SDC34083.1 16S rRNA (cytosine967-C5)-methyltransferase [Niabella drilacis]